MQNGFCQNTHAGVCGVSCVDAIRSYNDLWDTPIDSADVGRFKVVDTGDGKSAFSDSLQQPQAGCG